MKVICMLDKNPSILDWHVNCQFPAYFRNQQRGDYEWTGMYVPRQWQQPFVNRLLRPYWMHIDMDMIIDNWKWMPLDDCTWSKEI